MYVQEKTAKCKFNVVSCSNVSLQDEMLNKQEGSRPGGRCDTPPSRIITDYHRKKHFAGEMYV